MLAHQTFGQGHPLVFIHGWGANSALWRDWIAQYFSGYQVTLIDLPGHGQSAQLSADDEADNMRAWLEALLTVLPAKASIVGWSLGGLLAQSIALYHPQRVDKLVLVASSPCFVQKPDWLPALEVSLFSRYLQEVKHQTLGLLRSFFALQTIGSTQPKQLLKQLLPLINQVLLGHTQSLKEGLAILEHTDVREQLVAIQQETLWLFAEQDAIVPVALSAHIAQLQPKAKVMRIDYSGHLPFLEQPVEAARMINAFLEGGLSG